MFRYFHIFDYMDLSKYFTAVELEELTHIYKWNGVVKSSATSYLKQFSKEFDEKAMSNYVAVRDKITVESVLQEWNTDKFFGITKGNMVHFYSEEWALGKKLNPSNEWQAGIIQFWIDLPSHYILVNAELKMYSHILDICGTCDVVLYNTKTSKYVLVDYKTNKDLWSSYGLINIFPYEYVANNYYKYSLQLSIYEIMLNDI